MRSEVARSSTKKSCTKTAAPFLDFPDELLSEPVPENFVLQSVLKTPDVRYSHFNFASDAEKGHSDSSCHNCARTRVDSPQNNCVFGAEAENQTAHKIDQLTAQNNKLIKEIEKLRTSNRDLRTETVVLNSSLKNLKQQFNFVYSQLESTQQKAAHISQTNSALTQRLAFSEQKLEQYIASAFEQEDRVQELSSQLSAISRKYEAQKLNKKLALVEKSRGDSLNAHIHAPDKTHQGSVDDRKRKPDISEVPALKSQVESQNQLIAKLLTCLQCLFKDKWSAQNWQQAKLLLKQHANSFVLNRDVGMKVSTK